MLTAVRRQRYSRTGKMIKIFIDRPQFDIIHAADWSPRHLLTERMTVRIDAGPHRRDEFFELPVLDHIEIRPERRQLSRHAGSDQRRDIRGNPDRTGCIRRTLRSGLSAAR